MHVRPAPTTGLQHRKTVSLSMLFLGWESFRSFSFEHFHGAVRPEVKELVPTDDFLPGLESQASFTQEPGMTSLPP